jgi:hypothetical protein
MIVVLNRPMNGVARQTIRGCERRDLAILEAAKAAVGSYPDRPMLIALEIGGMAFAKPIYGCV